MLDFFRLEREQLRSMISLVRPDILHAHWQYEWGWAALNSGLPTLLTCHDSPLDVLLAQRDLYRLGRLAMAVRVFRKASNLTAVSSYTARRLKYFTRRPISIIPNFEPDFVFNLYRSRTLSDQPKIAMINNGFAGLKNVKVGIQAFQVLRQTVPQASLFLFGMGHGVGEEAERWSRGHGLATNVEFRGAMEFRNLMTELSSMDLLLHTALEESFGMILVEASAMGIPVVAGKSSGGVPWVLDEGRAGVLVDVSSPDDTAKGMASVLTDDHLYRSLSLLGRTNALERFSSKVVVDQYLAAYDRVLSTSRCQLSSPAHSHQSRLVGDAASRHVCPVHPEKPHDL
jgi:glycosyltransferase involved in cell wall biosynthesis